MKLIQILLSQSEAGAETYFEKVATVIAQDPSIKQRLIIEAQPSRESRLTNAGVDYRTLPMGFWSKKFLYNHRLSKEVKKFAPDVIVTWVNRASRKCPKTDAVVVGRLGGYYDVGNYQKCNHLIVNTPDLVRHVTSHGWPSDQVSMISNFGEIPIGLDVPEEIPQIPEEHRVLLALGRLHPKKAHDTLIRALPLIPKVTLLLAGIGELENQLKRLADDLHVSDRIHFLGLRKDVMRLFQQSDICVFPSRFEPLGNVILESWATETPVVAAASQGPSWLIQDEVNGLLFEIDDPKHCAEQVNRLLQDSRLSENLISNGRKTFEAQFSMEVIVKQYKNLFNRLLDQKQSLRAGVLQ